MKTWTLCIAFAFFFISIPAQAQLWPGMNGLIIENSQQQRVVVKKLLLSAQGQKKRSLLVGKVLPPKARFTQKLSVKRKAGSSFKITVLYTVGGKKKAKTFLFTTKIPFKLTL